MFLPSLYFLRKCRPQRLDCINIASIAPMRSVGTVCDAKALYTKLAAKDLQFWQGLNDNPAGLGAAIARRLAADGAKVVVNFSKREGPAKEVVAPITKAGGEA